MNFDTWMFGAWHPKNIIAAAVVSTKLSLALKSREDTVTGYFRTLDFGKKSFGPIFGVFRSFLPVNFGQLSTL